MEMQESIKLAQALLLYTARLVQGCDIMKRNILITEHNKDIRNLYEAILAPFGVAITFAEDIREAQAQAARASFDIIFLEIDHANDLKMAESAANRFVNTPVILVSTVPASRMVIERLQKQAGRALFMKPFDINTMRDIVVHFLQPRQTNSHGPAPRTIPQPSLMRIAV
jgi:DNA-binding NtrC family response regulator